MNIKDILEKINEEISYFPRQIMNWKPIKFIYNTYRFRRELAEHNWWDYHFALMMLKRSLIIMRDGLQSRGNEIYEHRKLKIEKITRVIQIIENFESSNHLDMAESELGKLKSSGNFLEETEEERQHNSAIFKRSKDLEIAEWDELWEIIKGKNMSDFLSGKLTYEEWFDGSDMRGWWD